ncbi:MULTISPECIES: fimbria/pilus outer membrane usher protein [Burkholderia]|uniref:fimbria/pilus outer membrane usher protein n=1 Tax=Burkholderia TaxID=32008 RepID=UPI000678FA9A|nr:MULTISPECIES: fimbria/pilus outer membrane usher protein [Burkholderia]KWU27590.1 fimbrial protein [Burkholderia cenocepacia]MBN3834697.1 fimbrial biogenesis outer membrane usher protein [Burkholderia sp. Ac-20344]OXI74944.1 fimbrial protein [Burkholderia sp. AU31280]
MRANHHIQPLESPRLALKPGYLLVMATLGGWTAGAFAADASTTPAEHFDVAQVQFNDTLMMKPRGQRLDLDRFAKGNPVPAGEYLVDLYVNETWTGRSTVRFDAPAGAVSATPCLDRTVVSRLGLDSETLTDAARAELARVQAGECTDVASLVAGATIEFDLSELRLNVSIPQASLLRNPRGYVSPELWDSGVPSMTLKYDANVFRNMSSGYDSTQAYLGLHGGANLGNWHFRHNGSYSAQSQGPSRYRSLNTYLQRDLPAWRSQLKIGETYTDGTLFESVGMRGATLESDDRMLPDSMRGYAPMIRGVATSNAHVEVSQNGALLYETNVAPGPFEINDLYPTGYGGNLLVTVTEADGRKHSFTVPYAAVVQSLRPGISRFGVAVGQLREPLLERHPNFAQATYQRGISNLLTGYVGAIVAENYLAGLVGAAFNTPAGAFAVDVTQASARIPGVSATSGQSVRVSYSKSVEATGTNVAVAAYRYSSRGYWGMRDAMHAREQAAAGRDPGDVYRQRNQVQLTLNQTLGEGRGTLFAIGSSSSYWNRQGTTTQFQVGYNNSLRIAGLNVSYNLSVSRQRDGYSGNLNNQVYANVTIPLGRRSYSPTLSSSIAHDNQGGTTGQMSLTGTLGESGALTYGLNTTTGGGTTSGGGNVQYRSPFATFSGSATGGSGYSSVSVGVSGGVVGHAGGVTLANDLGDTVAIIEAKDAVGARITNGTDVRIGRRGYAVLPYLTPYKMNSIELDPKGIPLDVEMLTTSQQVAPRANSVVKLKFGTISGRAVLLGIHQPDGTPIPFGSAVVDEEGNSIGMAGQGGTVFTRGLNDSGVLTAKWGDRANQACSFSYSLPTERSKHSAYARMDAKCDYSLIKARP